MWGGRTPPSGVVAGFRRDFTCNVLETKSRIAPRNVVPTQNAKSRLHPLGGLKPALRPPSGINTGLVKREIFPSPVYGRRCPQGGRGNKFAKRRRCWALPLPLLLLRRCRQRLYIFLSAIALPCYFKSCQAASMQGSPSGINTGFSFPPPATSPRKRGEEFFAPSGVVTGFCRDVACNVSETKNRIAPCNVVLTQNAKSRLRPLGGLKPALHPPSGISAGLTKRQLYWDCAQA